VRRLDRYIARSVWLSVLLVLLVVVGIDALSAFIDESQDRSESYGFLQIASYVVYTLPGRIYEYVPFAALIGSLIGLGNLASSSELVVMRAAGVSNGRLARVVLFHALLMAGLGFALGEYVAPEAEQTAQSSRALALYADRQGDSETGIWKRDERMFLRVEALQGSRRVFGISVFEWGADGRLARALFADRGDYQSGGWLLSDVRISYPGVAGVETATQEQLFLTSNVTPQVLMLENVAPGQLTLNDLVGYSAFLRSQGQDTADFELALWRKLLQPVAIAALVLVAISFVFGPLRDGTLGFRIFAGVMVGVLFRLSQDLLGPASLVFGFAPLYAAVLPVVLCAGLGLLLLRRA
jgi:lipopolysaccharide export system permease protein